jgi:hypothetical protein
MGSGDVYTGAHVSISRMMMMLSRMVLTSLEVVLSSSLVLMDGWTRRTARLGVWTVGVHDLVVREWKRC